MTDSLKKFNRESCLESFNLDEPVIDSQIEMLLTPDLDDLEDLPAFACDNNRLASRFLRRLRSTNALCMQNGLQFHALETLKRVEMMSIDTQICRAALAYRIQQTEKFVLVPC